MAESAAKQIERKVSDSQDDKFVKCSICSTSFRLEELEGHVCLEHLDYFPYSCGHCGHFFATDVLAHFHANKKKHFPVKIREHPDMHKEEQLEQLVEAATAGETLPEPVTVSTERNSNSPASTPSGDSSQDFNLEKVKAEPTEEDVEAEAKYEKLVVTEDEVMFIGEVTAMQAVNALTEIRTLFPKKKKQTPKSEHKCNICKVVTTRNKMAHAKRHFQNQNSFACRHCSFTGKSANSIRTHVTWKHKEGRPRDGVQELETPKSLEEMFQSCFGVKPNDKQQEEAGDDAEEEPEPKKRRSSAYTGSGKSVEVAEEERQFVKRVVQMPNGRKYKYLVCQACGMEVCDAVASVHIFQAHIQQPDMVTCGNCKYGTTYDPKSVKIHSGLKHRGQPCTVIDRRQDYDVQEIYKGWRQRCFPLLKGAVPKKQTEEQQVEVNSQSETADNNNITQERPKSLENQLDEHHSPLLALLAAPAVPITALDTDREDQVEKPKERSTRNASGGGTAEMCFNPIVEDAWCNKCSVIVLRREVEDHIWYAHLGGVLPYRCGRCQRSFVTIDAMENHWSTDHGRTPSLTSAASLAAEMEVVPNHSAKTKFDQEMTVCFPDLNRPSVIIKTEPPE